MKRKFLFQYVNSEIRRSVFLLIAITILSLMACEKIIVHEDDIDWNADEEPGDYSWDTSEVIQIIMNGSSVSVDPPVADINGSTITIKSAGTYNLTGSLTNGHLIVNTTDEGNVRLLFSGVDIRSSSGAPVYVKSAKKVIVVLSDGTENFLTDGTSYTTDSNGEPSAAFFSNSYLSFSGGGALGITANYNDGVSSDDGLLIKSGTISVSAKDDGLRGKDYVIIRDGNITINAKGDGIVSDNEVDAAKGYVSVDYGVFTIVSTGDAVSAVSNLYIKDGKFTITTSSGGTTTTTGGGGGGSMPPGGGTSGGYNGSVSAKGLKGLSALTIETGNFSITSADDALHSNGNVEIGNGTFNISAGDDAIHADVSVTINDGTVNITKSYEGIESALITVKGGNISLVATDDGFNATKGAAVENNDGSQLNIFGGHITVNCSNGDGLDSNGNITLTAGTVIVHGPQSQPEVGFDVNGTFNISGGLLVASGPNSGNMIEVPGTSSSQYSVKTTISSTLSSSTLFHIQDESGNDLLTFKPVRTLYYIVFSSPMLKNGTAYSIYTGGTSTGTNDNGLYTGGTYSGGTLKKNFTISGKITSVSF